MSQDPEIIALGKVYESLQGLDSAQIARIVNWVTSKFALGEEKPVVKTAQPAAPLPTETLQPAAEPVKKRRGRRPKSELPVTEPTPEQTGIVGLMKYDTIEDLFFAANVKTIAAKILLVAAYLQEKQNLKEFGSYDISSGLKKVDIQVKNISASINNLLTKKPPMLIQTGKYGTSKQSRRKYRVTEEGLRIARNYIIK